LVGIALDGEMADLDAPPHIVDLYTPHLADGVARLRQERL
jgi:hypothetical protein